MTEEQLQIEIKRLETESKANLEKQIERLKLSAKVGDARKELQAKIKEETKAHQDKVKKAEQELAKSHKELKLTFFKTYGEEFEVSAPKNAKTTLSLEEKAKVIEGKGYKLSGDSLVNAKGEPVTSTIVFKDANGDKQTLKASTFEKYLKDKK